MTTYLAKKNRAVRFQRLRTKAFEWFIPRLDIVESAGAAIALVCVLGICIILALLGLADLACAPVR